MPLTKKRNNSKTSNVSGHPKNTKRFLKNKMTPDDLKRYKAVFVYDLYNDNETVFYRDSPESRWKAGLYEYETISVSYGNTTVKAILNFVNKMDTEDRVVIYVLEFAPQTRIRNIPAKLYY